MDSILALAWLVPVLPLASAAVVAGVGKRLPWGGAEVGILSVGAALALSAAIAWETFTHPGESLERAFAWSPLGGGFVL
ncbi:MAG: hypothetical protein ACO3RG_05780, partial [Nitriliruptoraceae bacterium]